MKHLKYLSYVVRHKWFVLVECYYAGILWRGLVHDLSKLKPSEWFPYVEAFNGIFGYRFDVDLFCGFPAGWSEATWKRDLTKRHEKTMLAFDVAWLKHQHRNPHHWQHWILREDSGATKILEMPWNYMLEMICDWKGAGKAQGKPDTKGWYIRNCENIILHPTTRMHVEVKLGCYPLEMKEALK